MNTTPTGSYVIFIKNDDDTRIRKGYCRINTIAPGQDGNDLPQPLEMLCPVERIGRAKVFDNLKQAMLWKDSKNKHSPTLMNAQLLVKELMI